ncbi:MAG: acylneuraminate cytidylyltransferase family protein [Acidobacteriota bacterium]
MPQRLLALITARGGSRRVPGKNIKPLGGRPLVAWSIAAASGVAGVVDTLVSTDSQDIADVAAAFGAHVPWLRPAALATDDASSIDVTLHALDWYENEHGTVDGVLLLQPTSPFRRREMITKGCEMFKAAGGRAVIGVSPAASHPTWCYQLTADGQALRQMLAGDDTLRSQELTPAYVVNGAFYLATPAQLRRARAFLAADTVPLVMEQPADAIDIDTDWDWQMAEMLLASGRVHS